MNDQKTEQPSSASTVMPGYALTERELWLMERAYEQGKFDGYHSSVIAPVPTMENWLESSAADGTTVEMVLEASAPVNDAFGWLVLCQDRQKAEFFTKETIADLYAGNLRATGSEEVKKVPVFIKA